PLVFLTVLDVNVRDARVMLLEIRDGIVTTRKEVTDVQVDPDVFRDRHGLGKVVRPNRVIVKPDDDVVLLRRWTDTGQHREGRGGGDNPRAERFRHLQAFFNLLIRIAVIETQVVRVEGQAR